MIHLHRLHRTQRLPIPIPTAWEFFSDPRNLVRITPPDLDFVITSGLERTMHPGQIITYTIRPLMGVRRRWVTEITHVDPPHLFVDEQRFGPYRFWHHLHRFVEVEGGVEMTDTVHYLIGIPLIDPLIDRFVVRPRLEGIFDFRKLALEGIFGGG